MSIKDLFKKNQEATQILKSDSISNISKDAESSDFVQEKIESKERFIPQFDFDDPKNFARFGLAEEYYDQSLKRVYNTYPYDGSRYEVEQWHNSSSFFDKHIFDNEYPRTTGYAIFGDDWGTKVDTQGGYAAPATSSYEYILIKGGPNKDADNAELKDMFPSNDGKANLFNTDQNRECNLKIGGTDGNTVEFWLKKKAFDTSNKTRREVILDVYSTSSISSSVGYGRFRVEMDGDADTTSTSATATDAIDIAGYIGSGDPNIKFTITIPATAGGTDKTTTFHLQVGTSSPSALADHIRIGTAGLDDASTAALVIKAINGGTDSRIAYGNSAGDGSLGVGIVGITADQGSSTTKITLTMVQSGTSGNVSGAIAYVSGVVNIVDVTAFTGAVRRISPFLVTYMSGTNGVTTASVGNAVTVNTVCDNKWHHYALSVRNSNDQLRVRLYVDGEYNDQVQTGSAIGYVSSSLVGTIGALAHDPSRSSDHDHEVSQTPQKGWGKLSASLDEFRFWKQERTAQQVGRNWYTNVYGGANTDLANTQLGVYFKFNEGITGTSSLDSVVLDYSGRASNGTWEGYDSTNSSSHRSTGSAINEGFLSGSEYRDPIIRSDHPDVQDKLTSLATKGRLHDLENNSSIYNSVPEWIRSDDQVSGKNLVKLTQIISNYFDTLAIQTTALPKLKAPTYPSSSHKALPFADHLLENHGLLVPELFTDSTILEQFAQQSENTEFDKDLRETKNLIYKNIYNNLSYIYKSKGTEKAFRNLIRCFGIDDEIVRVNIYGDNSTYEITGNYRHTVTKKNYLDFNTKDTNTSVVYQFLESSNTSSTAFITSSYDSFSGSARTLEAEIIFPEMIDPKITNYEFTDISSSLFGFHTAGTQETSDTESTILNWPTPLATADHDIRIYAVRESGGGKSAHFKLESTFLSTFEDGLGYMTSSLYDDVYNNEKWNFAIRFKRDIHPLATGVTSSVTDTNPSNDASGSIEFYGVNVVQNYVKNEFLVTSSISLDKFNDLVSSAKRIYAGAHRQNFGSTVLQKSDVKVGSVRYWLDSIPDGVIREHAYDVENYGTEHPGRNAFLFQGPDKFNFFATGSRYVPQAETLALHWNFTTLTGSDDSGEFIVTDASSGSATSVRYGDNDGDNIPLARTLKRQHTGKGQYFPANSSKVVDKVYVSNAKMQPPEVIASSNMIEGRTRDDRLLTRTSRPITHFIGIEKSPYQSVTDEMLKVFATLTEFNNLIGEPVNTYRPNYKQLDKLKQLFFEKVDNVPNVEKYIDYYKWIDNAIDMIIHQLMPISANTSESLSTMIESHVLERNKFRHKYPIVKSVNANEDIEASTRGQNSNSATTDSSRLYDSSDPRSENYDSTKANLIIDGRPQSPMKPNRSVLWWKNRAERNKIEEISSGDTTVDKQREIYRKIITSTVAPSGSSYESAAMAQPYRLRTNLRFDIGSEVNDVRLLYAKHVLKPFSVNSKLRVTASNAQDTEAYGFKPSHEFGEEPIAGLQSGKKRKLYFALEDVETGEVLRNNMAAPFSVYTSSEGRIITNIHNDTYIGNERPLQGPFTEKYVGGLQHRHIQINSGSELDTDETRPEGFKIHVTATPSTFGNGTSDAKKVITNANNGALINYTAPDVNYSLTVDNQLPRAMFFRDEMAKRPVNIRNIKSSSYGIGNYSKNYEVVMTNARSVNNKYFVEIDGAVSASVVNGNFSDLQDFALPERTKNETVIVNRFSAPGGPDVMSRGMLDTAAEEYAVHNAVPFRNLSVRQPLQTLLRRHTSQFGEDSVFGSNSGSLHKVHRNTRYRLEYSGDTIVTGTVRDNAFVSRPIPQSDLQYSWITASAFQVSGGLIGTSQLPFGYEQPNIELGGASNDITFISGSATILNNNIPLDFVGLNYAYIDEVDADNNIISPGGTRGNGSNPDFAFLAVTQHDAGTSDPWAQHFLLNRNGPYGYPIFKQVRHNEHRLARYQRKNNIYSFYDNDQVETIKNVDDDNGIVGKRDKKQLKQYTIPAITTKFKPLTTKFLNNVEISHTYGNLNSYLVADEGVLDDKHGIEKHPPETNEAIKNLNNLGIKKTKDIVYTEIIYPRAEFTSLAKTRGRLGYNEFHGTSSRGYDRRDHNTFWRDRVEDRLRTNSLATNSLGHGMSSLFHTADGGASDEGGAAGTYFAGDWVHQLNPLALSVWPLDSFPGGYMSGGYTDSHDYDRRRANIGATGELYGQTEGAIVSSSDAGRRSSEVLSQCFFFYQHYGWFGTTDTQTWPDEYYISASGPGRSKPGFPADTDGSAVHLYHFKPQYSASTLAGVTPWYDSYEAYADNIRPLAKDYSIIPEFKISEHMEYYLKNGFLSKNSKYLSLKGASKVSNNSGSSHVLFSKRPQELGSGTSTDLMQFSLDNDLSSSANDEGADTIDDFFKIYSHSDFLDSFDIVRKENPDKNISEITLKCKGIKKLLPYQGFYPVNRCMQLGTLFSQSFGSYLTASTDSTIGQKEIMQSLMQPFFAPGIVYNTIKSGLAVDWPVVTGSTKLGDIATSFGNLGYLTTGSSNADKQYHNRRFPFEALVEPEKYIPAAVNPGAEQEATLSARVNMIVSPAFRSGSQADAVNLFDFEENAPHFIWKGDHNINYNLAMHNFLGEVPRFFLEDERLTTFASKQGPFMMVSGTTYFMDVVLEKTKDFILYEGPHIDMKETHPTLGSRTTSGSARGLHYGPACDTLGERDPTTSGIAAPQNTNYNWLSNIQDPAFAPYTPPYFYGESVARISFTPHQHRLLLPEEGPQEFTLNEVLEGAKIETVYEPNRTASYGLAINSTKGPEDNTDLEGYIRVPDKKSLAAVSKMKIDSSINLFGKTKIKEVTYDTGLGPDGKYVPVSIKDTAESVFDVWTISPKFECPTLNFSGNAKGHFTRGMWFGYGAEPEPDEGIFLRIRESFPQKLNKTKAMKELTADPTVTVGLLETGSLVQVCGFSETTTKSKRRIGRIANRKVISEAVVAIPFRGKSKNVEKGFFNISRDYIDLAMGTATKTVAKKYEKKGVEVGTSVVDMVEKMHNYVIPPQYDFLTNKEVDPFVMYIFEFEHVLDKEDLSNIWQNLMPKIAKTPEFDEVEITHPCGIAGEFFEDGDIPSDIKWMIFKVKKRAEKNYFNITADSTDDDRFKFEFNVDSEKKTPDYSYNWPYDFFSLVELSKIETSIKLSNSEQLTGVTTNNNNHNHSYNLDSNGNGFTDYAVHPDNPNIKHRHKVINGVVQSGQSDCYPDCEKIHGTKGVGPHKHGLNSK